MAASAGTRQIGIRLQLLGEPRLNLDNDAFPLERKDAALLALLAIDGATPRARAAALLWSDVDDDAARNNLRQRLHRLRRRAGRDIALTAADVLRLADGVSHDLTGVAERLAQDANAATGELLGSLDYADCEHLDEWLRAAREQWRATRSNALAEIASKLEREGQIALALQYGERLLADDALREHAHRRLMRLHYLRGDRAAALAAFDRCRELLKRELSTTPGNETLELAALIESSGAVPSPAVAAKPVSVLRPPKLVGRDAEWVKLEVAWQRQRFGLVCGEPGIGKTRLLSDFIARQDGAIVVGARPGDARVPFALLARLLRAVTQRYTPNHEDWAKGELSRILPELGAAPESKLQPVRFQRAIAHALLAASSAGLTGCAIDDLQFADDASVESLLALTADEQGSTRWLGGVRSAEMPRRLVDWLERTESDHVVRIDLGPLDVAAIEALLTSLALPDLDAHAWAGSLARHTGGNPLFILETLSALLAQDAMTLKSAAVHLPAPGSVGQLIERRLQKLSREALKLARVAALAGQDFSVALAACVLSAHPLDLAESWRELEAAQIIRADREGSAFAHDLILETTLRSVPKAIAKVLHRDIAAYLTVHDGQPEQVAHHWFAAEDKHKAAEQFAVAARRSFDASRFGEAGTLYERAADCYASVDEVDERHRALQEVAGCRLKAFDLVGAHRVSELLRDIAQNDTQLGWALDRLVDTLNFSRADDALAEESARKMLELGDTTAEPWMVFHATRKLAIALAQRGRLDEALRCFDTQTDWIRDNQREWNVDVWFCDCAFVMELANQRDAAIVSYEQTLALARAHQNWHVAYTAQRNLSHAHWWSGHLSNAVTESDAAVRYSERLGDLMVDRNPRDTPRRAVILRGAGRFAESLELLLSAQSELTRGDCPYWLVYCQDQLAQVFLDLGQPSRARPLMDGEVAELPHEARVSRMLMHGRLARRSDRDALPWSRQAYDVAVDPACPARWRILAAIELAQDLNDAEGVIRCRNAADDALRLQLQGIGLNALARGAACAVTTGQTRTAERLARDALTLADTGLTPTGMFVPEFFLCIYRAFRSAGDNRSALQMLRRGVSWINDIALPNIPAEFCDSFLNRNPINRAILTAASRWR